MRIFLFGIILLTTKIVNSQAIGQIAWETILGTPQRDDTPGFIHPDGEGNFILVGGVRDGEGQLSVKNIMFYWLDSLGNEIKKTTLDLGGDEGAGRMFDSNDGNYILFASGECLGGDGRGNHSNEIFSQDMIVSKITRDAKLIWKICIGSFGNEDTGTLLRLEDGYILIFQFDDYLINGDIDTSFGKEDIMVMRLSEEGDILWKKVIGGSDSDYLYSILLSKGNNLFISARSYSTDGDLAGRADYEHTWICRMDLNGNIERNIFLGFPDCTMSSNIGLSNSDSLILFGQYGCRSKDRGNLDTIGGDAFYVTVDTTGELGSFHFYGGSGEDSFYELQNYNSDYLFIGDVNSNDRDLSARPNSFSAPWLVKLNSLGEIIGQYVYESVSDYFSDVYILNNEEFLLVGSIDDDIRIIKLSSKFNDIKDLHLQDDFILYPNPANERIFIEHQFKSDFSLEILNSVGQRMEVKTSILDQNKLLIDVSKVSRGIYFVSMAIDGIRSTKKLIIE